LFLVGLQDKKCYLLAHKSFFSFLIVLNSNNTFQIMPILSKVTLQQYEAALPFSQKFGVNWYLHHFSIILVENVNDFLCEETCSQILFFNCSCLFAYHISMP